MQASLSATSIRRGKVTLEHIICSVDDNSAAARLNIVSGSALLTINGEEVIDIIDYEKLCTNEDITVEYRTPDGAKVKASLKKELYEPLGLNFADDLIGGIRSCKNRCLFCFIDQMVRGGRETLHVKDDDWRMSLIMGNYITLTNVSEAEFERILRREVSPLYISVHTTEPELRIMMMKNPTAGLINERLKRLAERGIGFHCQIVLCPGINDGEHLDRTLGDLKALYPHARSVAVVPVGLTAHREGLYPLRCMTGGEARETIARIEAMQKEMREKHGEGFVYASDEMYIAAGEELPEYGNYDDFLQLENGVGLLRKFERELLEALSERRRPILPVKKRYDAVSGTSAAAFLQELFGKLKPYGIEIKVHPVKNRYLGETVTVAGLVSARDIEEQLKGRLSGRALLLPACMMRENDDIFLDGMRLGELQKRLGKKLVAMSAFDGGAFIEELFNI